MSKIDFKKANSSDLSNIFDLLKSVDLPIEGVTENVANFILYYASSGELICCAGLEIYDKSALLRSVAVHSDHQGMGLGKVFAPETVYYRAGIFRPGISVRPEPASRLWGFLERPPRPAADTSQAEVSNRSHRHSHSGRNYQGSYVSLPMMTQYRPTPTNPLTDGARQ